MSEFMRLKKIKGAEEYVNNSSYTVNDYKDYLGKWKSYFKNDNPIHLEIGCGKGDFLIGMAKQYKDINFIGIEKYPSVLIKTLQKLENENLENICFICMDASVVDTVFEKEIDVLYLNFSDPWPKKKHSDRRLTSKIFLDKYSKIFESDRIIEMKTDNRNLFEYSLVSLSESNYILKEISLDLYQNITDDNVQTEYERKFVSLGMPIYRLFAVQSIDTEK